MKSKSGYEFDGFNKSTTFNYCNNSLTVKGLSFSDATKIARLIEQCIDYAKEWKAREVAMKLTKIVEEFDP